MPLEGSSAVALRSAAGALQEAELDRFLELTGQLGSSGHGTKVAKRRGSK